MKNGLSVFCIVCIIAFFSCKTQCGTPAISLDLEDFDSTASSVMVMTTYQAGSNLSKLVKQEVFVNPWKPGAGSDTGKLPYDGSISIGLDDIVLSFPLIKKTVTITNVGMGNDKMATRDCTNSISYRINDTPHTLPSVPFGNYDQGIVVHR